MRFIHFVDLYGAIPSLHQLNHEVGWTDDSPELKPRAIKHYRKLYRFYEGEIDRVPGKVAPWEYLTHNDLDRLIRDRKTNP